MDGEVAARLHSLEATVQRWGSSAGVFPFLLGCLVASCVLLAAGAAVGLTWWQRQRQRWRLEHAANLAKDDDESVATLRRLLGDALPAL